MVSYRVGSHDNKKTIANREFGDGLAIFCTAGNKSVLTTAHPVTGRLLPIGEFHDYKAGKGSC
jgi:hypothetical protein